MKRIALFSLLSLLAFALVLPAQTYKRMMKDPNVNFYDVVKEAEEYFREQREKSQEEREDEAEEEENGWTEYQRWKAANESRYYPSGVRNNVSPFFAYESYKAFVQAQPPSLLAPTAQTNSWRDLGPYYIQQITGHYAPGLGRIECFYVNPRDTLKIYLGSRSGGFWRSSDGGKTWRNTTDFLPASGVNAIAVSPTNPDSILINVRNANNGVTHGIYRSTDGGLTWQPTNFNPTQLGKGGLGSSFGIDQIAYSPHVRNLVIIAANDGLYRSIDNLQTWTKVTNGSISEICFHPTNSNIIYIYDYYYWGSNKNVVLRSLNAGASFAPSATIVGNNDNTSVNLSVSKNCPDCLYFASSNGIWKSTDNGLNFSFIYKPAGGCGAFCVNDQNQKNMIYGGIDVLVSTDEGKSFTQKTWWSLGSTKFNGPSYVHADLRVAKSINGVFYLGTDGYLCKSTDGGTTWVRLSEGTGVRENYSLGVGQSNSYRSICGSQDNGQSILTERGWLESYGADGMEGIIHPLNANWIIGSYQNGGRIRYKDGGVSPNGVTPPGQANAYWIAPLLNDPNNQMRVYSLSDKIYRSDDFGTTWIDSASSTIGVVNEATIAENNSNIMLIAAGSKLAKSTDAGKTFSLLSGLPDYSITDIAFDPRNDNTIIVSYNRYQRDSAKVFISRNGGQSWTNITYNLQNMPVNSVVIDHSPDANIYLGTEIGVYTKKMSEYSWSLYNQDLPNTMVYDLKIQYGTNTLRAATWGRGLWECSLVGRSNYPSIRQVSISAPPSDVQPVAGMPQTVRSVVRYEQKPTRVYVLWSKDAPVFNNSISMHAVNDTTYESDTPLPDFAAGTKMFFKVFAIGTKNDTTQSYKFMYTVKPFKYCDAAGASNTTADYINKVTLSGVTKSSDKESYADFTSTVFELYKGGTYTLNVGMNYHWEPDTTAAWIDYNHDADFSSDEQIVMSELDSLHRSFGTFSVPAVVAKDTTRMRVRSQYWNEKPDPCDTRTGEVEDYTIVFKPAPILSYTLGNTLLCNPTMIRFAYTGEAVDSLRWELRQGDFLFTSMRSADSVMISKPGIYSLSLKGYKQGIEFSTVSDSALRLLRLDTSVTQESSNILRSNADSPTTSYQWLSCSENYRVLSGATSQVFAPPFSGLYAVEVRQGSCVDTSACYLVQIVSVDETTEEGTPQLRPNPTTGISELLLGNTEESGTVSVFDMQGRKLLEQPFRNQSRVRLNLQPFADGVYFIELRTPTMLQYYHITKGN